MSQWNWKPERTQGVWRTGPAWLRPFLSAVPWITVLLLVLMFHIVGGTLVSSEGVLFDLPDSTWSTEFSVRCSPLIITQKFLST